MRLAEQVPLRVALTGHAGCGKTTLAKHLESAYRFKKLSLADEVRKIAQKLGYSVQKPYSARVREILQVIGMTGRELDPDTWTSRLEVRIPRDLPCVVDDVRFVNEALFFSSRGFVIVKLEVPEEIRMWRLGSAFVRPDHYSEREVDLIVPDLVLSGLDRPETNARKIFEFFGKKSSDGGN